MNVHRDLSVGVTLTLHQSLHTLYLYCRWIRCWSRSVWLLPSCPLVVQLQDYTRYFILYTCILVWLFTSNFNRSWVKFCEKTYWWVKKEINQKSSKLRTTYILFCIWSTWGSVIIIRPALIVNNFITSAMVIGSKLHRSHCIYTSGKKKQCIFKIAV